MHGLIGQRTARSGRARGKTVLPVLAAGLIAGLLATIQAIAYAGLIYGGPLAGGMAVGISAILLGFAVTSVVAAFGSSHAGLVVAPFSEAAVVYPLVAVALAGALGPAVGGEKLAMIVAMVCGLVTALSGVAFLLMGVFRLGSLARLLPYPVISGFNAGSGWLFISGAIGFTAGGSTTMRASQILACIGLGLAMVGLGRLWRHWVLLPVLLVLAVLGFHLLRAFSGMDLAAATRAGWLLGPYPPGLIWAAPTAATFLAIPWPDLARLIAAPTATIILVGGTTAIMAMTSMELELHRRLHLGRLHLDREMAVSGWSNIAGGLAGGLVCGHSVSATSLAQRMGGDHRAIGLVAALSCASLLVLGSETLTVVPRFVVAALLFANGLDRLIDRILLDRVKLPLHEWLLVVFVLGGVILVGYVQGVVLGLFLTLLIFAWNYRRISVIRGLSTGIAQRSSVVRAPEAQEILAREGDSIRVCRLQGYLFFLNAVDVMNTVLRIMQEKPAPRFLVLDFRHVAGMDISACLIFRRLHQIAAEMDFFLLFTALPARLKTQFATQNIATACPATLIAHDTTDKALQYAEDSLLASAGLRDADAERNFSQIFSAMSGEQIAPERLAPYLERKTFKTGDILMRQGDAATEMFFIERGRVAAQLERADGPPVRLRSSTAGTIVGEIGLYAGGKRTATVLAEAPCVAARLSIAAIARMAHEDPILAGLLHRFVTTRLAEKLSDTNRMLEQSLE